MAFTALVFGSIRETVSSPRFATQTQCLSKAMSEGFGADRDLDRRASTGRGARGCSSRRFRAQTEWKPTPTEIGLPAWARAGAPAGRRRDRSRRGPRRRRSPPRDATERPRGGSARDRRRRCRPCRGSGLDEVVFEAPSRLRTTAEGRGRDDQGCAGEYRRQPPAARPSEAASHCLVGEGLLGFRQWRRQRLGAASDSLQVGRDLAGVLDSGSPGLTAIACATTRSSALRQRGHHLRGPRPRRIAVGEELRHVVVARERRPAGEREVEEASQCVDVGAVVDPLARDLLGSHVVGAAQELAGGGDGPALPGRPG